MQNRQLVSIAAAAIISFLTVQTAAFAEQANWRVSKISGQAWLSSSDVQRASLANDTIVRAGDDVRTGSNGRVLLTRGEETILISPNSAIAIPESSKDGLATTISQKIGEAVYEVEKRNVRHFQVETPYLAAVVKGTAFRVSVSASGARVNVTRGSVDVADFKSGQHALVFPGQSARVASLGGNGLLVRGPGNHAPILQGSPRPTGSSPNSVRAGVFNFRGTHSANDSVSRLGKAGRSANSLSIGKTRNGLHIGGHDASRAAMRITAPVGEVKLDIAKVTKGLAGSSKENTVIQNSGDTIWSSRDQKQATGPNVAGSGNNGSGSNSGGGSANNSGSGSTNGNGGSNSGNGNGNSGSNNGVNSANKGNGNGNGNGNGHKK